jgi:hypothetical protein
MPITVQSKSHCELRTPLPLQKVREAISLKGAPRNSPSGLACARLSSQKSLQRAGEAGGKGREPKCRGATAKHDFGINENLR